VATEQENLVLNVTLVDNASAGLDKLNQQLKQLGGEQHASAQGKLRTNFAGVQNAIKPLVGDFSRLSTSMTNVTKSAMSMIPALAGVGTAVLGVGGVLMAALIPIKKFASEMTDLGQLARETGHNAATIKMFREEFGKLFGSQGIALADTTLRGLQRSMTDILNPASKLRQEMEQGARHTPEMRENMDKLITKLKEAAQKGDTTEFFNIFEEGMDSIRKNISAMPNRGPVVAAQWVNDLNKLAGIPEAVAATHIKLKGPTEEAIRNTQALIEQSTQLTRSFNSMAVSVDKISGSLSAIVLGFGPVVKGAQLLADAMERIASAAERWARTRSGNLTPEEKAEQEKLTEDIFKNAPQYPGRGVPPPVTPQRFSGGGANDNSKLLEEENKRMSELTSEIKRLSDLLMVPTDKPQGQGFHNTPRGGAKGESNPMQLPDGIAQPGGGAPAEARSASPHSRPLTIQQQAQQALDEIRRSEGIPAPGTPLPQRRPPSASIDVNTAGPLAALGASYVGNRIYSYDDPRITNPLAKETIEENRVGRGGLYGFAYPQMEKPEAYYQPGSGQEISTMAHEFEHVGRAAVKIGAATGSSLEPNVFKRYGAYVEPSFASPDNKEEHQQRYQELLTSSQLKRTGQISLQEQIESSNEVQSYLRRAGRGAKGDFEEAVRHSVAQQDYAQKMLADPFWSRAYGDIKEEKELSSRGRPGPADEAMLPSGSPLSMDDLPPYWGAANRSGLDRRVLDSTMGGEISTHQVEGSASIDINVGRSAQGNRKSSSLFKMPKMERQSSGTPASRGPAEDISGGANSGIYT